MSTAEGVAAVLVVAMTLYAFSGLADYGAGFWDLFAGTRESGAEPRRLIDAAVTPVWEANHVWLVFILVVAWTGFGPAFASIMSTLFIPLCLAAVYLVAEARRRGLAELEQYFRVRAMAAAAAGLTAGLAAAIALFADNRQLFDRVLQRSIPLLLLGIVALIAALTLAAGGAKRGLRVLGAAGVAALIWAWALAQQPYLLPFTLTVDQAAGAPPTLKWLLAWSGIALLLVVPALALLYTLDQRSTRLGED